MKIYTKTGDDGSTGLIGGERVRKCDRRIDCVGTIDEINASLGCAAVVAPEPLLGLLIAIQNDLFVIGSHLALPEHDAPKNQWLPSLDESIVTRLEMQIDAAEQKLPALRNFILPGGVELAARLHLARTVCRRAERAMVALKDEPGEDVSEAALSYANRLSDFLFVASRFVNAKNTGDVLWVPGKTRSES